MANYAQRRDALIRTAAEAGEMVGRQKMADLMALALNDPAVMGKDVLGPERKETARMEQLRRNRHGEGRVEKCLM